MVLPAPRRRDRLYYKISPASLVTIVLLNFLLVYLNLSTLENQNQLLYRMEQNIDIGLNISKQQGLILEEIAENTNLTLQNQEIGLNISAQNQGLLNHILEIQQKSNETFFKVLEIAENRSQSLSP